MTKYLSTHEDQKYMTTSITDIDRYSKEIVRSGAALTWHNISVTAISHGIHKKLLRKNSGISYPNEILAVMGSSGSGKSSLVTLLADQFLSHEGLEFTGSVYLNDVHLDRSTYSEYVKFVNQHDILMPTLTARETLTYSALLQCCGTANEIFYYVSRIMEELNIAKCADQIIGDSMIRGLSGGEKKLVSIANELISQPSVLVLDEPTSGLDSMNALRVIKLLKQQSLLGKNIILTIHQPSNSIFEMIDRLLLLSGGRVVFQGRTVDAYKHFGTLDFVCPFNVNPCDYYDKICHVTDFFNIGNEEYSRLKFLVKAYKTEQLPLIQKEIKKQFEDAKGLDRRIIKPTATRKIKVLFKRTFLNSLRHPFLFILRIIQALFIAVLNAVIFNNIGYDQKSVQNRNGLLFYCLDALFLLSTQVEQLALQSERLLYIKETKQNYYGIVPYFFSKFIAELPVQFLFVFLFTTVQYFAIPLNMTSPGHFFVFFFTAFLTHVCGAGLGYFSGSIANSSEEAIIIGGALGIPLMMYAGYFSNANSIATATSWILYISPFNYAFEVMMLNEYENLPLNHNVTNPLPELGIYGEIGPKIGQLFSIEILYIMMTILVIKYKERYCYKIRALR